MFSPDQPQVPASSSNTRRDLLKGAMTTGLAIAGAGLLSATSKNPALAASLATDKKSATQRAVDIITVARTAEQLAVTMYSNGIANQSSLKFANSDLRYLKAAVIEEQLHQDLLASLGANSLTSTFSFPGGAATFTNRKIFIDTLVALESAFQAAYIAAVREFAILGFPEYARVAVQIGMVESMHYNQARNIGGSQFLLTNNVAYVPCPIYTVEDAPEVLADAGFLSPVSGNSYTYAPVDYSSGDLEAISDAIEYKTPYYAGPPTGKP